LRASLEAKSFFLDDTEPQGKVTVSIGIASFPVDASSVVDLVMKADASLCRAKRAGRNRVEIV
jgi:diguanylate cyclase (GGDEF)-like protein